MTVQDDTSELTAHVAALRRYARSLVGNTDDADDLVQETLKRALQYGAGARDIRNPRAYLFTMLHNVRIDEANRARRRGVQVDYEETGGALGRPGSQDASVRCGELGRALMQLREEERQVVLLVAVEGMAYREAASALGVPIGTIMSRLSRGRAHLLEQLDPAGGRSD